MNVLDAIMDPEMGYVPFTVRRITYQLSQGATTSSHVDQTIMGCVHPGTPEMMQMLPEEEKCDEFIVIYTENALSVGINDGGVSWTAADRIIYRSQTWKVVKVKNWSEFGYYFALAVLIDEEST